VQFETSDTRIALIIKAWLSGITTLSNDAEIDWQMV
jgi:hypothetical protein